MTPDPDGLAEWLRAQLDEDEVFLADFFDPRAAGPDGYLRGWSQKRHNAKDEAKRRIIDHVLGWDHDDPDGGGYYSCPLVPGSTSS